MTSLGLCYFQTKLWSHLRSSSHLDHYPFQSCFQSLHRVVTRRIPNKLIHATPLLTIHHNQRNPSCPRQLHIRHRQHTWFPPLWHDHRCPDHNFRIRQSTLFQSQGQDNIPFSGKDQMLELPQGQLLIPFSCEYQMIELKLPPSEQKRIELFYFVF